VVVAGPLALEAFLGQPTDRIHLYRYNPAKPDGFEPIPFQIDRKKPWDLGQECIERHQRGSQAADECEPVDPGPPPPATNCETGYDFDSNGDPVPGVLKKGDELVFLAKDTGPRAPDTFVWKSGATDNIRYEIEVQDKDSSEEIIGQGWVYAFLFLEPHAFELELPYYVDDVPNASPDPDRPRQLCTSGDPSEVRRNKACGTFRGLAGRATPPELIGKQRYELRYLGHWIWNRFYAVPPNQTSPAGEFVDRFKYRALGYETEEYWSQTGCASVLGVKRGAVRTLYYIMGAASGPATTRVDRLYPTHLRSTVRLRVHCGVGEIKALTDYLAPPPGSQDYKVYVESGSPTSEADVINGQPPASFPLRWEQWTEVHYGSLGRLVYFFKENRPMPDDNKTYYYEDRAQTNNDPEWQAGAYGNHGERWPGPLPSSQDTGCYPDPDAAPLYREFETTIFVADTSASDPTADARRFADWMARPLRYVSRSEQRSFPKPPPDPRPICRPSLAPSVNPENGRYLDLQPTLSGCSDWTTGFALYKAVGDGAFQYRARIAPGGTFRDWTVNRNQTYRYRVFPVNSDGVAGPASDILTMTVVDHELPPAPTNLEVTSWSQAVHVSWKHSTAWDLRGYNFYLSTSPGGPYWRVNSSLILLPTRSYTASNLETGRTYYGVVRAVDWAGNEGPDSAEVSGTPGP